MRMNNKYICIFLTVCILITLFGHLSFAGINGAGNEKEELKKISIKTVLDFGAIGDGTADDTEAIQRAVDSRIGNIYFPRRTYRITKSVLIELDRIGPISIRGDGTAKIIMTGGGPVFKIIGTHEGTADPTSFKNNVWERQRMPLLDGLEIVGEHPEAVGIEITKTMQATFTRLLIRHTLYAIHLTERNRNVTISECHLYQNRGIGVFLDHVNLHQINITNCHISYNGMGGIVARPGNIRNLQISGCDIEGNMDVKGPPTANLLIDISDGNSFGEGAIIGCTLQHTHLAPNSANIRFIGPPGENEQKMKNFTIADNVLSDVAVNIDLLRARGITITGNTIWKGYSRDILVKDCSDIIIANNVFDRNPTYKTYDSVRGLLFRNCTDCILSGLLIKNPIDKRGGIILDHCKRFNITNCSVFNYDSCGIFLDDAEFVRVSGCMVLDYRTDAKGSTALKLTKGKNNMIVGNLFVGKVEIAPGSAYIENNYSGSNKK